jgi:hypothetical protein
VTLPQERRKPRTPEQRKQDALNRLEHDTDAWVTWRKENELEGRELMRGEHKIPSRTSPWSGAVCLSSPSAAATTGAPTHAPWLRNKLSTAIETVVR